MLEIIIIGIYYVLSTILFIRLYEDGSFLKYLYVYEKIIALIPIIRFIYYILMYA